jgi:hypothetical protein
VGRYNSVVSWRGVQSEPRPLKAASCLSDWKPLQALDSLHGFQYFATQHGRYRMKFRLTLFAPALLLVLCAAVWAENVLFTPVVERARHDTIACRVVHAGKFGEPITITLVALPFGSRFESCVVTEPGNSCGVTLGRKATARSAYCTVETAPGLTLRSGLGRTLLYEAVRFPLTIGSISVSLQAE